MLDEKRSKTLNLCVVISLMTHALLITVLQTHSLWFYAPIPAAIQTSTWSQQLEKISPNDLLKEAFAQQKGERHLPSYAPQKQLACQKMSRDSIQLLQPPPFSFSFAPSYDLLPEDVASFPVRSFQLPDLEQLDFFADLPKDLILPSPKKMQVIASFAPKQEMAPTELLASNDENLPRPAESSVSFVRSSLPSPELPIAKVVPSIPMPSLPQLPSLAELETMNLSDSFESELTFHPKADGKGYIFALTLLPRSELNIPKLRQNIIFLVDRSNSIQKDRLQSTKHAISRALEELDSNVLFNVISFDTRLEKLFPTLTSQGFEAKLKANKFIDHISLGSLFSVGDLSKALFLTIPSQVADDELYTAILLTDGESLSKKSTQRALFKDWTLQNRGRVSLYVVSLTGDPHLASLDATCAINKGKLITSTTNRGLKRKLMRLAQNIRHPIAKGVVSRAVAQSPRTAIQLSNHLPPLYQDEPYVILGSTDTLDDFIIFIQARLKDGWMNVKKSISFADAKKGGESLEAMWALHNAYQEYEKFVIDDKSSHLSDAAKLLEPFDMQAVQ